MWSYFQFVVVAILLLGVGVVRGEEPEIGKRIKLSIEAIPSEHGGKVPALRFNVENRSEEDVSVLNLTPSDLKNWIVIKSPEQWQKVPPPKIVGGVTVSASNVITAPVTLPAGKSVTSIIELNRFYTEVTSGVVEITATLQVVNAKKQESLVTLTAKAVLGLEFDKDKKKE